MVFITGDTHGDFRRFGAKIFREQKAMTRDDYVIICGDFGGLWDDSADERNHLKWLEEKPFTLLWVDGNHENFSMLKEFPIEEWHGGKVHRIRSNIIHLIPIRADSLLEGCAGCATSIVLIKMTLL